MKVQGIFLQILSLFLFFFFFKYIILPEALPVCGSLIKLDIAAVILEDGPSFASLSNLVYALLP